MDVKQSASDLASVRDWAFEAQPNPYFNGRVASMSMGKVLRGGSSINVMAWARGHQNDWDYLAVEAGDSTSNYEAVVDGNLKVYGIQKSSHCRRLDCATSDDRQYNGPYVIIDERAREIVRRRLHKL
jgi:choline dehydrogenase-like flavoprotein